MRPYLSIRGDASRFSCGGGPIVDHLEAVRGSILEAMMSYVLCRHKWTAGVDRAAGLDAVLALVGIPSVLHLLTIDDQRDGFPDDAQGPACGM